MGRFLALALAPILLASCSALGGSISLTGSWEGTVVGPFPVAAQFDLSDVDGVISGSGVVAFVGMTVTGTRSGSSFELDLSGVAGSPNMVGSVSGDRMTGEYFVGGEQTATFGLTK